MGKCFWYTSMYYVPCSEHHNIIIQPYFKVLVKCKIVTCTFKLRKSWTLYFEEPGYVVHTLTVYNDKINNSNAPRIMISERPMIQVVVISHYLSEQKFSAISYHDLVTLVEITQMLQPCKHFKIMFIMNPVSPKLYITHLNYHSS